MTYPITPNPAIHVQPKDIGSQQMLFSGGQLSAWAQQLPLAMTLKLMDAILKALGVSQSDIDAYNQDETAYYNAVQTNLATVQSDITALQADASGSNVAFAALLTSWEAAITGYTDWSTFIAALESAWTTYSTTESGLTSSAIFTLQNLFNTLLGISPTTGQIAGTNVSSSTGLASLQDDWNATVASLQNTWDSLFGSTAPPSSGSQQIGQDVVSGLTSLWNAWFGTTSPTTSSQLLQTAVQDLDNAWTALFGSSSTPTTGSKVQPGSITNVLGGANLGADVTSVHTTASNGTAWATRLTNDLTVLLDVFHLTYTSTQWNSAWADLMTLLGIVNSVTTPTDPTPTIGPSITAASAAATTAGTNASIAIASNQATNDAIVSATTGATVTGTSTTDVTTGLSNIPATNIVGGSGAAVAFGAVGAGNNTNLSGASSGSISWSHTIATGDLCVLVLVCYSPAAGGTGYTSSATYGGVAMTMLQRQASSVSGGAAFDVTEAWVLKAPASGSKTVAVSLGGSASINTFSANSASYSASKIGTVGPNTGGGSSTLSMSASSATGKMVVGAFGVSGNFSGLPTLSAYNQTSRYNARGLVFGDAAGAGSVSFTATASGTATNVQWAGITVELTN